MESDENRIARLAVAAILADLTDRRGLRQEWEGIDADIRKEIEHAWYLAVLDVARPIVEDIKKDRA